jgi:uncharacterized repeat protein (TIGR04076 family)
MARKGSAPPRASSPRAELRALARLAGGPPRAEIGAMDEDAFDLWDLRVEVVAPEGARLWCGAKPGDHFELRGEMLHMPPGQGFSIYSLAALLPLLPAKQRPTDPHDWMTSDAEVACPDPNCPSRFRITRTALRRFRRAETTATRP